LIEKNISDLKTQITKVLLYKKSNLIVNYFLNINFVPVQATLTVKTPTPGLQGVPEVSEDARID
jgi:hypothetical protein